MAQEHIEIDRAILSRQVGDFDRLKHEALGHVRRDWRNSLSGAYSSVSGLDQLGAHHGAVFQGGSGSAFETLRKYADQVSWLRDGLVSTERALTEQEGFVDRAMQIADEGGYVGESMTLFPERPAQDFEDFDFPQPSVSIPDSLDALAADFASTDSAAVATAVQDWQSMSKNASNLAEEIRTTAWDIAEINKADAINAAVEKALEIADAADVFSANASTMATSVQQVGNVEQAGGAQVSMAQAVIAMIPDPEERKKAEQAFLQQFMGSTFPAAVQTAVPQIRNLMTMQPGSAAGGGMKSSMNNVAGNGKMDPIEAIQQMTMSMAKAAGINFGGGGFQGISAAQDQLNGMQPMSADQFNSLLDPNNLRTESAGLGATMQGIPGMNGAGIGSGLGSGMGSGFGSNPNALGTMGVPIGMGALNADASRNSNAPKLDATTPSSVNALNARGAGAGAGTGFGPVPPMGVLGAHTPSTRQGVVGAPNLAGLNAGAGINSVSRSGLGAIPTSGSLSSGSAGGSQQIGQGTGTGSNVRGMGGSASGAMRGMMGTHSVVPGVAGSPGAAAGAGTPTKKSRVKSVTSQVEEDTNVAAIVGGLPPVVPGTIGAWARN